MWRMLLLLLTGLCVSALPAANEYGDCNRDDLYTSLQRDGEAFCTMILDPECYTTISTPTEFATYDDSKLSSYLGSHVAPKLHATVFFHCHFAYFDLFPDVDQFAEPYSVFWTAVEHYQHDTAYSPDIHASRQCDSNRCPSTNDLAHNTDCSCDRALWKHHLYPSVEQYFVDIFWSADYFGDCSPGQFDLYSVPTSSATPITSATLLPGNTTSSSVIDTSSATSSATLTVTTSPGNTTSTQVPTTTAPTPSPTPFPASNFTGVLRGPALPSQACHHRPEAIDGAVLVAALQNEDIRHRNLSLAYPYVGAVGFDSDGITPLYLSVRDAAKGSHLIDVSDPSAVTIFDSRNNSMRLDLTGIHFVTGHCNLTVSYIIDNMYAQLAQQSLEMCSRGPKSLLATEQTFTQTLFLRDQCNEPVGPAVRPYPDLRLDDEQCIPVGPPGGGNGTWVFNCPWQSAGSSAQRCMSSLQRDAVDFLLHDPFNGGCADVSSVVTLLDDYAQDLLNTTALQQELYNQVGNDTAAAPGGKLNKVDDTVMYYMQLWESLKSTLSRTSGLNPGRGSNLKQYLDTYNRYRNFAADACGSIDGPNTTAVLSLSAGSSEFPTLASFGDFPVATTPLTARIQNPAKLACCPNGGVALTSTPGNGTCAYPPAALVPDSNCVCGKTAGQQSVAFSYRQCDNFVSQCDADADCADAGYAGYLCLIGSCCGKGVCFDPFECSRADVPLLPGSV